MNTVVSDHQVIINIQGIRYIHWGETNQSYLSNAGRPWYVIVTYKGNNQTFYYRTEGEARGLFDKLRQAMDKSLQEAKKNES